MDADRRAYDTGVFACKSNENFTHACIFESMGKGEILHDYFGNRDGGGRLVLTLGESWCWPVIGGFVSKRSDVGRDWPDVMLRELGAPIGFRPWQPIGLAHRWGRYKSAADTVFYSGSYAPMAVRNHTNAMNVLYCHSPPRFIYDQRRFYLRTVPSWQRPAFLALISYLKPRYEKALAGMDRIIANSENVRSRLESYLGFESVVVPPPCDTQKYQWQKPEGYYLSTARLDPLKRVHIIMEAFKRIPDKKLVVVSDGPQRRMLQRLAAGSPNIRFVGEVSDKRLSDLIGRCIATIYIPIEEDFGMAPVESMAAGKPVIGVNEGGLRETMVDQQTGVLLPSDFDIDELVSSIEHIDSRRSNSMRADCERRAEMFNKTAFLERISTVINRPARIESRAAYPEV